MKAVEELSLSSEHTRRKKPCLIPVFKQTERRLLSVFMALLDLVPVIRSEFLAMCGYGAGKTSTVQSFMEVSYPSQRLADVRPDGLIACKRGSTVWSAFIEAKAENKPIRPDQIADYASLAASLDVDAIITISNEFAFSPTELPYHVAGSKRKKRDIYHFAWADIRTFLAGLSSSAELGDIERQVLSECLRYFWDTSSGISTYDAMPAKWPEFVQAAGVALGFGTKTQGITEIVHGWQQERRDLCSKLTYQTELNVELVHSAGVRASPDDRLAYDRKALADQYVLTANYSFRESKAQLTTVAELQSCRTNVTLQFLAPPEKKARAAVNWFLSKTEGAIWNAASVTFDWKGRGTKQAFNVESLRGYPYQAFEGQKDAPKCIRVMKSIHDVRRFKSRKKFIEDVEAATISMLDAAIEADLLSR